MALDTRTKRASVIGVGRPYLRTKEPGTIDVVWRASSGNATGINAITDVMPESGGAWDIGSVQIEVRHPEQIQRPVRSSHGD